MNNYGCSAELWRWASIRCSSHEDLDRQVEGVFADADSAPLPVVVSMVREAVGYRRGERISLSPAAVQVVRALKAAAPPGTG